MHHALWTNYYFVLTHEISSLGCWILKFPFFNNSLYRRLLVSLHCVYVQSWPWLRLPDTYVCIHVKVKVKVKLKQSRNRPRVAQRDPGGLRSQISWHSAHEGGEVFSLKHRSPLPPEMFLILLFTRGWVDPQDHGTVGRKYVTEKSSDTSGNRSRDHPSSSTAPSPLRYPRPHIFM